jgi:hypothetical protein
VGIDSDLESDFDICARTRVRTCRCALGTLDEARDALAFGLGKESVTPLASNLVMNGWVRKHVLTMPMPIDLRTVDSAGYAARESIASLRRFGARPRGWFGTGRGVNDGIGRVTG